MMRRIWKKRKRGPTSSTLQTNPSLMITIEELHTPGSSGKTLNGEENSTNMKELFMKTMAANGTLVMECQLAEWTSTSSSKTKTIITKTRNTKYIKFTPKAKEDPTFLSETLKLPIETSTEARRIKPLGMQNKNSKRPRYFWSKSRLLKRDREKNLRRPHGRDNTTHLTA